MAIARKARQNRKTRLEQALRRIHFLDLEIYLRLARRGTLSEAARELGLQAPHVSKSLKRVETAVGLKLFHRSTNGLVITPEGRQFLELCQKLTELLSTTPWIDAPAARPATQRLLNIAGSNFLAAFLAESALTQVTGHSDRYRFRVVSADEHQLTGLGIGGTIDIAFHARPLEWPKTWTSVIVGQAEWVLCARAGHPLGTTAHEEDLLPFPWITPTQLFPEGYRFGEDKCPLPIPGRRLGDEVQSADMGLKIAASSDQLIFVPEVITRDAAAARRIQVVRVRQWAPVRQTLYLSAHSERVPQRVFRELVEGCRRAIERPTA